MHRPGEWVTMLRTFTLLLFCIWLSLGMTSIVIKSQLELWIDTNYPEAPWENITLWYKSPSWISSKFLLLKDETQMTWICPSYKTFQVSFPIGALTKSNTGFYRCCYWKEARWSESSKVLELEAPGQLPKPSFWIQSETSPLPGHNISIFCHSWLQDLVFMLFKEGYAETVDYQIPTGTVAIFSIANMAPEREMVYICRAHIQILPTLWSEPSNPLKLIVAGLYPEPTLTVYPGSIMTPGESLNLRCQGSIYGMIFALIKLEDLEKSFYHKRPIKNEAHFFFQALKIRDAGHYLCFYDDGSYRGSVFSDTLKIWVTRPVDEMGLALYTKGEDKSLQLVNATNIDDDESFFLNNVTSSDIGIYTCHYLLSWKTSIMMTSHNTMERVVVEWEERTTFQKLSVDEDFIISIVEGKITGTYSCIYHIEARPNIQSHCSEPLKLLGPAVIGLLTWNYILNEVIRLSLSMHLLAIASSSAMDKVEVLETKKQRGQHPSQKVEKCIIFRGWRSYQNLIH